MKFQKLSPAVSVLSRALVAGIFISAGVNKLIKREQTRQYMKSKGLPLTPVLLPAAASVEILGGLSLLLGARGRAGAAALGAFLIPTSIVFHDFWNLEGQEREMQMVNFMKNLAILGGLVELTHRGTGQLSMDRVLPRKLTRLPFDTEKSIEAA